ncbi:MAG: ABC transporter substrate-binding protein [Xanthobacteraceae bacterium]|nr:ABC transporter substrate-binding protein [Xanthobacteraceae bacterium]
MAIKRTGLGIVLVLLGLTAPALAVDPPRRIVSFNLCADQLLLVLADPSQIAALSPYATDETLSVMVSEAASFPKTDWNTESVVNLAPDLVLTGFSDRPARALLSATGLRVVQVDLVKDLAAARAQVREIGALVGHPERGEALAQELEQAESELRSAALRPPRTALIVQREGYTEGTESLASSMLSAAGLKPPANAVGGFGGFVSMETLLTSGPDVLVLQEPTRGAADQGALFLTHPALLARYGPDRRINLPSRYTLCGGPALLQGLDELKSELKNLR